MKNNKVFLSNGEEVELLTQYQDGNKTEYVVKVVIGENSYEGESELVYENRIVSAVYKDFKDMPMYLRKTELENKVDGLNKEIKELTEQKTKVIKELKQVYIPQYLIGTIIYYTSYGNEVEELKIVRIVFTEQEDRSFYNYYCNKEYRSFEKIGDNYYLTKNEAEEALRKYRIKQAQKKLADIKENYEKAKTEYEKNFPPQ